MSLSKLPAELVAQVATHLDPDDLWNLMESSKKNYHAIKYFGAEKIKLDEFTISTTDNETVSFIGSAGGKIYNFKNLDKPGEITISLKNILDKVSKIGKTKFLNLKVTNEVATVLKESKAKIGYLFVWNGNVDLSPDDIITFCKKSNGNRFTDVDFSEAFWTDEVLCKFIPYAIIYKNAFGPVEDCSNKITDLTLTALVGENGAGLFKIGSIKSSITIRGIINLLKKRTDRENKCVDWDLGILRADQAADAIHYFGNGMFEGYFIDVNEKIYVTQYTLTDSKFIGMLSTVLMSTIIFAVAKQ